jgi:hypothetical protein
VSAEDISDVVDPNFWTTGEVSLTGV